MKFYVYIGRHLKFIIRSLHDLEGFSYVALVCKIFSSSKFNNTSTLNMDYSSFVNILFCTLIFYLAFPSVFWSMNFWDNVKWIILSTKTFHLNRKELHLLTFYFWEIIIGVGDLRLACMVVQWTTHAHNLHVWLSTPCFFPQSMQHPPPLPSQPISLRW